MVPPESSPKHLQRNIEDFGSMKTWVKVALVVVFCSAFARPCSAATHVFYWGDLASVKTNIPSAATNIVSITGGDDHIIALRADGTVVTWGANFLGSTQMPTNLANVVAIAAGSAHNLALL